MNVVIYARYSCSNQREESIEGQLKVCYEFAKRNNYNVIGEYIDEAISGKTDKRPQFQQMIEDSNKKIFKGILVYQLDRFARNRYDSAIYKAKLKKNDVRVFSARENISDDASGILMESVLEGMAEYYSAELAQKVNRGLDTNAEHCLSTGGTIPLGFYIGNDKKYHINNETAPIVVKIFEMYANGNTMKKIIDYLNSMNYKTVKGNSFNKNSIYRMLSNKKYIGYYIYKDLQIKDGIPQIIDDELFKKCQRIIEKNKKAPARTKAEEEYLLTTKIFCGKCNSQMVGISGKGRNKNKYCYYKCKNSIEKSCDKKTVSKEYIENIVVNKTKKFLTDKNIKKVAEKVVELCKKSNNTDTLKYLIKQQKKVELEINNLLKVLESGKISDLIIDRISVKKGEKENIEKQILIEKTKTPDLSFEKVVKFLESFRSGNINDIKYRKSLINVFVNKVIVYENKLTILYNLQDSQSNVLYNTTVVSQEGFEPPTPGLEELLLKNPLILTFFYSALLILEKLGVLVIYIYQTI